MPTLIGQSDGSVLTFGWLNIISIFSPAVYLLYENIKTAAIHSAQIRNISSQHQFLDITR